MAFVLTAATLVLSSGSSSLLVLFAAGFLVGTSTGCERNDAEESKSPHAPALAIIARHISHFLRNDVSRNLACRNIEMCHKQATCYSLNERVLMNILCSYEYIGIEEIEVKIRTEENTSELQSLMRNSYDVY